MVRRTLVHLLTMLAGFFFVASTNPSAAQNPQKAIRGQDALREIEKKDIRQGIDKKLIIAAAAVSIADEQTLIRRLLPYSTPPDSVAVVLNDETAVMVGNLEWIEVKGTDSVAMLFRLCMCTCIRGKTYTCAAPDIMSYEQCCDRCCRMRLEGPQPQPSERLSGSRLAEVDASLAKVGLKRALNRKKTYPIAFFLFGPDPNPQQTITCMQKDEKYAVPQS